jgi:tetratricopeptide (TPR) repeat protein
LASRAKLLEKALLLRPNHPETERRLALTYLRMGKKKKALFYIRAAFSHANRLLETTDFSLKLYETLLASGFDPKTLWTLMPYDEGTTSRVVADALQRKEYMMASEIIERSKSIFGSKSFLLYYEYQLVKQSKGPVEALALLKTAEPDIKKHGEPEVIGTLLSCFADAAFTQGSYEESLGYLREALRYKPGDPGLWGSQVALLISLKRFSEARQRIIEARNATQRPTLALSFSAMVAMAEGGYMEAIKNYQILLASGSEQEQGGALFGLVDAYAKLKDGLKARHYLTELRSRFPSFPGTDSLESRVREAEAKGMEHRPNAPLWP